MDIARPDISRQKRPRRLLSLITGIFVLTIIIVGLSRLKPALPTLDSARMVKTVEAGIP